METEKLIEMVVMARQGDENALETLYLDSYKSVYRLSLRMVKNQEDAEDITQEVFITVQGKISELREPSAFYRWINQITVNKCNYMLRKFKGIARLDDEEEILALADDDPLNLPDKAIDDAETRRIIMEVIDDLPDGQRICIMLYYFQQNTISQIADMLETNENTVKSRLSLARAKIRKALEEKEKKEGIKLYGIPLALTPILRQAMEEMAVPDGLAERVWDKISQSIQNAPIVSDPAQGLSSNAAAQASTISGQIATGAGMTIVTKTIIGIIAAVVLTAGAIVIPQLIETQHNTEPSSIIKETETPAVSDSIQDTKTVTSTATDAAHDEPSTDESNNPTSADVSPRDYQNE